MALNATLAPFPADFEIWEVRFSDRMDEPFDLRIKGASTTSQIDLRALLGERVTLALPDERLLSAIHGIVRHAARCTPEPSGVTVYELAVAPAEWVLSKRTNSRIFQKQSATEIVATLLREHPIANEPAVFTRSLAVRDYCVQYDETDMDFARRLLAEEGVAAYFEHSGGGRWTLVDDTTLHKPSSDPERTVHANAANLKPGGLAVLRWRTEQAVETIAAARRDYDLERPHLRLEETAAPMSASSSSEVSLESYAYEPDRLLHLGDDSGHAGRDLEAIRSHAAVVHLETNFAAGAGESLRLVGEDLAGEWLVTRCEMHLDETPGPGVTSRREISLTAIPLSTPYRPVHRKRPLIFGTQSARVVGATPEGTVDVDHLGRVNVELRWDRRELWARGAPGKENPTRRVRVAQAWAGAGYGFVTLPRVGEEVLIAYEDGNPDRPVVIGRMHNPVQRSPLSLPDVRGTTSMWRSQSFGPKGPESGYNAIAMDDTAGGERLSVRAERDLVTIVGRHSTRNVVANDSGRVGGDQTLRVGGNRKVEVGDGSPGSGHQSMTLQGNFYLDAKIIELTPTMMQVVTKDGNLHLVANGERLDLSTKKHHIEAPSVFVHACDGVQVLTGKMHVHAESEVVLQVKGSSVKISAGGVEVVSAGGLRVNGSPVKLEG